MVADQAPEEHPEVAGEMADLEPGVWPAEEARLPAGGVLTSCEVGVRVCVCVRGVLGHPR